MKVKLLDLKTLIIVLMLLFYLWFAFQIPYTHDDWVWGTDLGIENFLNGSENGRYAGNFFEIVMTRSLTAKTLIMGGCLWLIPLLITELAAASCDNAGEDKKLGVFVISNILLLLMNRSVFRQTYAWVAGFSNFVLSGAFLLLWIGEINRLFAREPDKKKTTAIQCTAYFALSLICQLFIENIAILCVILAAFLCVVYLIRVRRVPARLVWMMAGAVLGIVISFGSSVYDSLWSTGTAVNGYRTLSFFGRGGLLAQIKSVCWHFGLLTSRIYGENIVVSIFILILMSVLVLRCDRKNKALKLLFVVVNVAVALVFLRLFPHNRYQENVTPELVPFVFAVSMIYCISITGQLVFVFGIKQEKKWHTFRLVLLWLLIPAVMAPLAFTTEIGPRLFYTCNMLSVLFIAYILFYALNAVQKTQLRIIISVCLLSLIGVCAFHGVIYERTGNCARERNALIADCAESIAETLTLPAYPYPDYLWHSAPASDEWWGHFRNFYNIPDDTEIVIN